jgi:hypothetical protein
MSRIRKQTSLQQFQENLKLIPDKEIYPTVPKHITIASVPAGKVVKPEYPAPTPEELAVKPRMA